MIIFSGGNVRMGTLGVILDDSLGLLQDVIPLFSLDQLANSLELLRRARHDAGGGIISTRRDA